MAGTLPLSDFSLSSSSIGELISDATISIVGKEIENPGVEAWE